ncbi:hypothetical protein RND81_07G080200 [Saponaria officinalis]|uniref:Ubiquitin-like protease family profile domain-containing protein n=1 Tax=Saponaria officinalis TaxID=3572 RepID=A0AAW1JNT1_SAPOF
MTELILSCISDKLMFISFKLLFFFFKTDIGKLKRKNKSKDTRESANKLPKKAKSVEMSKREGDDGAHDSRPLSVKEIDELGPYCRSLEEKLNSLSKGDTIKMMIDDSVYNYQHIAESFLTIVEIRQMLRNQWLNVVMLQIWGSFLYQYATENESTKKVGYMCPVKLLEYMHRPRQCEKYIAHVLKIQDQKKFIMGAFYEGTSKKLDIKGRLNAAWILHCVNGGRRNFAKPNKLIIKVIECPQQPEGYECGYYVMKWMYNITFYYSTGNEKDFEKVMADSTMSLDDINEIKEVWATKCLDNM